MSPSLPRPHSEMRQRVLAAARVDDRIHSVLAAGSYAHGGFDEFSDLDLVIVVKQRAYRDVLDGRTELAMSLGPLLGAFTGEHVGEPRLLICLFGPPLLHVDLKFVTMSDMDDHVERPGVLFSRDRAALEGRLDRARIAWPNRDPDWFEARVWIWLHYAAAKLGRGELFEAIGMLAFLREQVLGPLLHRRAGRPQKGLRRVEALGLDPDGRLAATVARPDVTSVRAGMVAAVELYLDLRHDDPPSAPTPGMPAALLAFMPPPEKQMGSA